MRLPVLALLLALPLSAQSTGFGQNLLQKFKQAPPPASTPQTPQVPATPATTQSPQSQATLGGIEAMRKAAEGGDPAAQDTLGGRYHDGWGIKADP